MPHNAHLADKRRTDGAVTEEPGRHEMDTLREVPKTEERLAWARYAREGRLPEPERVRRRPTTVMLALYLLMAGTAGAQNVSGSPSMARAAWREKGLAWT